MVRILSNSLENFNNLKNEINSRSWNNSSMRAKEKFNQTFSKLLSRNIINQVLPQKLKSNENTDSAMYAFWFIIFIFLDKIINCIKRIIMRQRRIKI